MNQIRTFLSVSLITMFLLLQSVCAQENETEFVISPYAGSSLHTEMPDPSVEAYSQKPFLLIRTPSAGVVFLDGDIKQQDRVRLFSREYRSADQIIIDRLLIDTVAGSDNSVTLYYDLSAAPISETTTTPDFTYQGRDIEITAIYAEVSDEFSEIRSNLAYIECRLDTGVVNQHWCSLAGDTACGTAAGVVTMQISYPSSGDELFTRLNTMRKYSLLGDEFSSGPAEYYLAGEHISNGVNKYISEELSGSIVLTDQRTVDKTTEDTLIELLTTGRPAVIEVCYLLGKVTRDFQGISHWITVNGFSLGENGYTFRFADSITVSYVEISSEMLDMSNANVSYGGSIYIPVRYIGAFSDPLFSIEPVF